MFVRPHRLSHPARHPVSFAWQTQSTTDSAQVERWARNQPQANFITATGMVHDVLDVPLEAGRSALERLLAAGVEVGPVAESAGRGDQARMLFFTATRGTPEDEDEWWPCALDCHPETMDEHPGLRWHCRGSYVLVPPAALPGDHAVSWVRGMEHALPDPLTLLEALTDACAAYADSTPTPRPRSPGHWATDPALCPAGTPISPAGTSSLAGV